MKNYTVEGTYNDGALVLRDFVNTLFQAETKIQLWNDLYPGIVDFQITDNLA